MKCEYCKDKGKFYSATGREIEDCYYCKALVTKTSTPPHYDTATQPIQVIEERGLNFSLGNVIKYVARVGKKTDNQIEDLDKAKYYIEREIERLKGK